MNIPRQLIKLGCGARPLTYEDFERCAADEGIWVYRRKLRHDDGMFFYFRNRPVIVLNKALWGVDLTWAAFHELAHYYLHPPALRYFARGTEDKADYEANIIAAVVLIPKPWVLTKSMTELCEEFPVELLWIRKDGFERYDL